MPSECRLEESFRGKHTPSVSRRAGLCLGLGTISALILAVANYANIANAAVLRGCLPRRRLPLLLHRRIPAQRRKMVTLRRRSVRACLTCARCLASPLRHGIVLVEAPP